MQQRRLVQYQLPTMRVLWFAGRPFPVSSHPRGVEDPGTHWHVQTPDGEWHAVIVREAGDSQGSDYWGSANRWAASGDEITGTISKATMSLHAAIHTSSNARSSHSIS
jgi:hypothetical protein